MAEGNLRQLARVLRVLLSIVTIFATVFLLSGK